MDLGEIRDKIDVIDNQIKELYFKRLEIVKDVAAYKIEHGMVVLDRQRENEKIKALTEDIEDETLKNGIHGLFNRLMADSRRAQYELMGDSVNEDFSFTCIDALKGEDLRVIYQGEPGAYSQAAAKEFFGNPKQIINVSTWRDAMEMVKDKKGDFCVLPIENSTAGSVTEIYDLLPEYELSIIGEQVIPIEHMLLGVKGSKLSDIKKVYSHPQALAQCNGYLLLHENMEGIKAENTAAAAKMVSESNDKTIAAIAGRINAEIYGLEILDESIQDENNNKTRFVILSSKREYLRGANKISISFSLPHEKGSLYHALSFLTDNDINLSLIESRPIRRVNWEYRFFIDIVGNLKEKRIQLALSGLKAITTDFRILGNY